ncbi:rRNA maturation RNase YbeY [Aureivirga sp. CE67]|uniref:rRNA maturation RNase YbeY n=1 Tax=Aureivirga sp. CE67 TaxID=1788983 RepID=UPI0018C92259|nr:rRNA maturation RNase YbeY [Aureivirga sp. CE67]
MVLFNYELDFELDDEARITEWIAACFEETDFTEGEINYIFCDDEYLHSLNVKYLDHDTLTDVISFDYTMGKLISGDIFISVERVRENAVDLGHTFEEELRRVMIHGVLHYMGYKDKTPEEKKIMRDKEDECLNLF